MSPLRGARQCPSFPFRLGNFHLTLTKSQVLRAQYTDLDMQITKQLLLLLSELIRHDLLLIRKQAMPLGGCPVYPHLKLSSAPSYNIVQAPSVREETLPTSIKEKETYWLKKAVSPLHHKDYKKNNLMGIWRVIGSTRLHNLAARSILVFNSTPSGNKLVGIHNRMGMKFASKLIGTTVVKPQLFKLIKGVLSVA
eukprot:1160245-Pelagomonas_calceolata.AAC.2